LRLISAANALQFTAHESAFNNNKRYYHKKGLAGLDYIAIQLSDTSVDKPAGVRGGPIDSFVPIVLGSHPGVLYIEF
jgi:hypothetical protein